MSGVATAVESLRLRQRLRAMLRSERVYRDILGERSEYQPWANWQRTPLEWREHPLIEKYARPDQPPIQWQAHLSQARFKTMAGCPRGGKSLWAAGEVLPDLRVPGWLTVFLGPTYKEALKEFYYALDFLSRRFGAHVWSGIRQNHQHGGPGGFIYWKYNGRRVRHEVRAASADRPGSISADDWNTLVLCEGPDIPANLWEQRIVSRIERVQGRVIAAYSPQGGDWMQKEFEARSASGDPDYAHFNITAFDNPAFNPSIAEKAKGKRSEPSWRHTFLGARVHYEGLVYGTWGTDGKQGWDDDHNIIPWTPNPALETCVSIDPGIGTASVGWWQIFQRGGVECAVRFDERVQQSWDTTAIREYIRRHPSFRYLRYMVIDPYKGEQRQSAEGRTDERVLADLGIPIKKPPRVYRGQSAIKARVEIVRSLICAFDGTRRLYVSPVCARWLHDRGNYRYPDTGADLDKPLKDNASDHTMDETSYLAAVRLPVVYVPSTTQSRTHDPLGV